MEGLLPFHFPSPSSSHFTCVAPGPAPAVQHLQCEALLGCWGCPEKPGETLEEPGFWRLWCRALKFILNLVQVSAVFFLCLLFSEKVWSLWGDKSTPHSGKLTYQEKMDHFKMYHSIAKWWCAFDYPWIAQNHYVFRCVAYPIFDLSSTN